MRLIDADANVVAIRVAIKSMKQSDNSNWLEGYLDGLDAACNTIEASPTIEAEPVKHGRWEYLQDDEWRCSNCHTIVNTGGQWEPMTDEFCRNCGAKMYGGNDEN